MFEFAAGADANLNELSGIVAAGGGTACGDMRAGTGVDSPVGGEMVTAFGLGVFVDTSNSAGRLGSDIDDSVVGKGTFFGETLAARGIDGTITPLGAGLV